MIKTIEEQLDFISKERSYFGIYTDELLTKSSQFQTITGIKNFVMIDDHEGFYEAESYRDFLNELFETCSHEYRFSNVSISEDNHSLSFSFQNKDYCYTLEDRAEWFSYDFIQLINTAFIENNFHVAYFECTGFYESGYWVFLDYKTANELEKQGFCVPRKSNRKDNKLIVNGELFN